MSHQKYLELCPIYALGALDGEDLSELKAHLASGCADCERQIREYGELTARLPQALRDAPLSPSLKKSLMEKIDADSKARRAFFPTPLRPDSAPRVSRAPIGWFPWSLAAVAGLLLAATLTIILHMNRRVVDQQVRLRQELEQVEQLREELEQQRSVITFLQSPDIRITRLTGTPKSAQGTGIVFWSVRATQAFFFASNLPVAPAGKTYQLWIITDKPVSAGIFGVNLDGKGSLQVQGLPDPAKAQKFAVTLEPAGGVPQPTGEILLLGSV
jgi:hypothetical protein